MSKWAQGEFVPKNPQKYAGKGRIKYRSGWEWNMMNTLDQHPAVVSWASESIRIPYRHPLTGKTTSYVPDFLVVYVDKQGQQHVEVIEVKPSKEAMLENAKSKYDKVMLAVNMAKWQAAQAFCAAHGMKFRVVTEKELFRPKK